MLSTIVKYYDDLMEQSDPRVADWFMMSTPWPSIAICVFYVYAVLSLGPRMMENRKPFEIRNIMMPYNFAMVVLSGYTFMEFLLAGWATGYTLGCQTVDYSDSPKALRMARVCWVFYITKFIELLDTIFFVMRKKNSQVTSLHVFHHAVMPASWWFGVKFVAGGFGTFHSLLNSFIHFLMYIYYGLAGLGPQYQKYLWWKRYMTKFQIIQFILVTMHSTQLLFYKDCPYPKLFIVWILAYAVIFLVLFVDFYRKSYKLKRKPDASSANGVANGVTKNKTS